MTNMPTASPSEDADDDALNGGDSPIGAESNCAPDRGGSEPCLSLPALPHARVRARDVQLDENVPADAPPEAVAARLRTLPPWQARYVLALMECGGIEGLACGRCSVSRRSVEKAQRGSPEFAAVCAEAVRHSDDLAEAACFRGATVGDLQPVDQGGVLVGYQRVRSMKDAEMILTLRGRLKNHTSAGIPTASRVEVVPRPEVPAILKEAMKRLSAVTSLAQGCASPTGARG